MPSMQGTVRLVVATDLRAVVIADVPHNTTPCLILVSRILLTKITYSGTQTPINMELYCLWHLVPPLLCSTRFAASSALVST